MKTAHLGDGDAHAPFKFRLGDEVTLVQGWGTRSMSGVIVEGVCEYPEGGGSYTEAYKVKRGDDTFFNARPLDLKYTKEEVV